VIGTREKANTDIGSWKWRIVFILQCLAYIYCVDKFFGSVLAITYDFWGFRPSVSSAEYQVFLVAAACLPSLAISLGANRPSELVVFMAYVFIYIPGVLILPYSARPVIDESDGYLFVIILLISQFILLGWGRIPVAGLRRPSISGHEGWACSAIWLLAGTGLLVLLTASARSFTIAGSFDEVAEVRNDYLSLRQETSVTYAIGYCTGWLYGMLGPVLFGGLWVKRKYITALLVSGVIGVVVYGATAFKIVLVSPLVLAVVAYTASRYRARISVALMTALLGLCVAGLFILSTFDQGSTVYQTYALLFPYRTLGVPALLLVQYWQFFLGNSVTLLSHVRGVGLLLQYPYDRALPELVGLYYNGAPGANAGTWSTDGFAAFGSIGPIISSMMVGGVLYVYDSLTRNENAIVAIIAVSYVGVSLSVTSLFTTLLTQGWIGLLILLMLTRSGWMEHVGMSSK